MITTFLIVVALLGYPFVAGIVFRAQKPPRPCGGKKRGPKYDPLPCDGPNALLWDSGASCADCVAYRRAMNRACWWPLAALALIPRRMFWLGHDVEVQRRELAPKKVGKRVAR